MENSWYRPMKNKKFLGVLRWILLVTACAVVGINLYHWNAKSLTGNVLPMPFGYGGAVVLTGSMEPAIMADELIIVKACDDYAVGDVVVFQEGSILVVHRIVAMDEETVTTRGDANNADDAPMTPDRIRGKVIAHFPRLGTVVRLIKTPVVTVLLILCVLLTVELPFRKKKNEDLEAKQRLLEEIRKLKDEL